MFIVHIITRSGMVDKYTCAGYEEALDLLADRLENGVGVLRGTIWLKDVAEALVRAYAPGHGLKL
jgi:hypothetical protein